MKHLKTQLTQDGSSTLFNSHVGEHYHSTFGAKQESEHIFIRAGLDALVGELEEIKLLEIGFGTGLNALLAMQWAEKNKKLVDYLGVEPYRLEHDQLMQLNYPILLGLERDDFLRLHRDKNMTSLIQPYYRHKVLYEKFEFVQLAENHFDLVFFDAFSPDAQPELWTEHVFIKIAASMKRGGVLTTYSCKGIVKRALKAAGFEIEKLPGPPGKREFLKAMKK